MKYNNCISRAFTRCFHMLLMAFLATSLFACASSPESGDATVSAAAPAMSNETANDSASAAQETAAERSVSGAETPAETAPAQSAESTVAPEAAMPPKIVESCKDQPYIKYEAQSRESIAKGLAATKAEKFGVGFRDINEHNTWSKVHNELFKQVNEACSALSECAKTHKKDKDTECVDQAKTFDEWQKLAKEFAEKAQMAETTQPPKICSWKANLDDPARCFHALADNIDKECDSDTCKETSDCWRGVGFLDSAIIQATQACGFVHQKLSDCRGYIEATSRRKSKFNQCENLQGRLTITVFPVF